MDYFRRNPFLALLLLAVILGFSFMGSRSLWEPDEGRYTNVALNIVDSNEWISLHRHPESLHFTKPPLTYWTMAASVKTFGFNTWAIRLPIAIAYILSILMIFRLGKIFCPGKPWLPALIFATSPLPFLAANYVSTDFILAACETLAVLCFAQYAFLKKSKYWLDGMWAGFGLAFLAKGPPGLLPLMAIILMLWQQKDVKSLFRPLGFLAFACIGLAWYAVVIQRHPGLFDYFIGHEVLARVTDERMQRSPEWYGPLKVYLPVFLLGALPWLVIAAKGLAGNWRTRPRQNAEQRFLLLWLLLPLLVFCLSRSRMPLYLLPLFTPFVLLLAQAIDKFELNTRKLGWLAIWIFALLGMRLITVNFKDDKDPEIFAQKLFAMTQENPREIVFVNDMARYGLHLYLGSQINKVSFTPRPKRISDSEFDMSLSQALEQESGKRVFVLKRKNEKLFLNALRDKNITPVFLGTIADGKKRKDQDRLVYTIPGEFERLRDTSSITRAHMP